MSDDNQFRARFKYYKRKKPPPSFDDVIDPQSSDQEELFTSLDIPQLADLDDTEIIPTNNVKEWKILRFKSSPGLVFIRNVFSISDQLFWASKCLKEYSTDTYKRNIDHPSLNLCISKWWEESQKDRSLEDKLRWSILGYHHDWDTKVQGDLD